jgi:hypothetical protein
MQRLANFLLGEDVQEGRLAQVYGQSLFEGIVKNRVARRIVEIRKHDGVFLSQRRCVTCPEVEATRDQCDDHNYGNGNQDFPEFLSRVDRNFGHLHGETQNNVHV